MSTNIKLEPGVYVPGYSKSLVLPKIQVARHVWAKVAKNHPVPAGPIIGPTRLCHFAPVASTLTGMPTLELHFNVSVHPSGERWERKVSYLLLDDHSRVFPIPTQAILVARLIWLIRVQLPFPDILKSIEIHSAPTPTASAFGLTRSEVVTYDPRTLGGRSPYNKEAFGPVEIADIILHPEERGY